MKNDYWKAFFFLIIAFLTIYGFMQVHEAANSQACVAAGGKPSSSFFGIIGESNNGPWTIAQTYCDGQVNYIWGLEAVQDGESSQLLYFYIGLWVIFGFHTFFNGGKND